MPQGLDEMVAGRKNWFRGSRDTASAPDPASWRGIIEHSPDGVLVVRDDGRVAYANAAAAALLGWSVRELTGSTFGYPLDGGPPKRIEVPRGVAAPLLVEMLLTRTTWNEQTAWFVTLRDITEQQRLTELEKERVTLLETMARGVSLDAVLGAVVRLIESQYPQAICTVLLLDDAGTRLRHVASSGFPAELIRSIESLQIGPGQGCCGTAAAEARTVISEDIAQDPAWIDWRDQVLRYGLRACWSVPIFSSERRVLGTLAIYYRTPRSPQPEELELAHACAQIAGIAVERKRADENAKHAAEREAQMARALHASEAQYRLLFDGNPHPMWVFDLETLRFLAVNDAAIRHYGYSREEFLAMSVRALRPEQDFDRFDAAVVQPSHGRTDAGTWRHRLKSGALIDVEIMSDDITFDGRRARLVLADDVTRQLVAQHELARISRAQAVLSRCNDAVIHAKSLQTLLAAICRIIVETGGYRMAWVGFAEDDEKGSIRPSAKAGKGLEYLDGIRLSSTDVDINGRGPGGRSMRSGKPTVIQDVLCDPEFGMQEAAREHDFRKIICLPLREGAKPFGLLCLYAPDTNPVAPEELRLLESLADNLAYGAVHLRAHDGQDVPCRNGSAA